MNVLVRNIEKKLREMTIFKPPQVVIAIVDHLRSGGKQSDLYNGFKKKVEDKFGNFLRNDYTARMASNNTVFKIKKLLDAGELDWLLALMDNDERASIDTAFNATVKSSDDGWGKYRLEVTQKAEERLKDFGWSLSNLKGIGIPSEEALPIVHEYDRLSMARKNSMDGVLEGDGEVIWHLRKFQGFGRYLYLHHLVFLLKKYPAAKSHYDYACLATEFYTRGNMPDVADKVTALSEVAIQAQGENLLRFEVWNGVKNRKAYLDSLKGFKHTAKSRRALEGRILSMALSNRASERFEKEW